MLLQQVIQFLRTLRRNDEGVTAIEYGLLAALIAVAIIAAVIAVQGGLTTTFNYVAGQLNESGAS